MSVMSGAYRVYGGGNGFSRVEAGDGRGRRVGRGRRGKLEGTFLNHAGVVSVHAQVGKQQAGCILPELDPAIVQ